VTTLLNSVDIPASQAAAAEAALIQGQVESQASAVRQAKAAAADGNGSSSSSVEAAVAELKRLKQRLQVGAGVMHCVAVQLKATSVDGLSVWLVWFCSRRLSRQFVLSGLMCSSTLQAR
jgi:hypothetical protein